MESRLIYCRPPGFAVYQPEKYLAGGLRSGQTVNFVAQQLAAKGYPLYYWESQGTAELDFVLQKEDKIIGIEVKKGEHVRSITIYFPHEFLLSNESSGECTYFGERRTAGRLGDKNLHRKGVKNECTLVYFKRMPIVCKLTNILAISIMEIKVFKAFKAWKQVKRYILKVKG